MFNRLSTRNRAIVTAVLTGFLLFMLISPVIKFLNEFISPPDVVKNIKVIQKNGEVDLSWSRNSEFDLEGYYVYVNDQKHNDENLDNLVVENLPIYGLENGVEYRIKVQAYDFINIFGSQSTQASLAVEFKVTPNEEKSTSFVVNPEDENIGSIRNIFITTFIVCLILFLLNIWVLFFKLNVKTLFTIGAFPSAVVVPYLVLTLSILATVSNQMNRLIFSFGVSAAFIIITYLLVLTTNIINGSFFMQLPLEQAAKASQFIFGLISTYLMFVYIFSGNFNIFTRMIIILPFIFYFTLSCTSVLKNISQDDANSRSILITLVMSVAVFIMSIWPIESIYAILGLAVVYYVLLNITLEIRKQVGRGLWVEYSVLFFLILFLLFVNGFFGIKGAII